MSGRPASGLTQRSTYLDYHASTPCDPRVVEAMLPYFIQCYANPSSSHREGRAAASAVQVGRAQVACAIGASAGELIFTSGATESNNLAILGATRAAPPERRTVIVSAIEHKAVIEPAKQLRSSGFRYLEIPVESDGRIDLGALANLVDASTALVSVQAANNEIGTIQPIAEIAQIVHGVGASFHCDAAQALGKIPVDVVAWDVDLLSLSSHKCYGPKGVGALYIRGGARSAPLDPLFWGGQQEASLRPGTLNVPGIVGFGKACELIHTDSTESARIGRLRDALEAEIFKVHPDVKRNGSNSRRLPGNSSLWIPGVDSESLIANLPDVTLSSGSACTSGAIEPSHVLVAIGLSRQAARECVRIGLGRFTMSEDISFSAGRINEAIRNIRGMG